MRIVQGSSAAIKVTMAAALIDSVFVKLPNAWFNAADAGWNATGVL